MSRQSSPNYAGLRAALVLGSVAASVIGGRVVTARDAAAQAAAQSQEPDPVEMQDVIEPAVPQPTPTPQIIIVYDLPPDPAVVVSGPSQPAAGSQIVPALPPPPVANGGGGGGGGKPKPSKKSKSS